MSNKVKKILSLVLMICMMFNMLPSDQAVAATKVKTSATAITRGQVCQMVNSLLGATVKSKEMNDIVNYKKSDKYYTTMSIAYNAGYIIPYEEGKICKSTVKATYNFAATIFSRILETSKGKVIGKHKSSDTMTLADFQVYMSEVIPQVITKNISKKEYTGNAVVNKPDLKLTDVTINGNLIIGDGVADQEVTLNNVTVTGKLIVRGGGENSVIIMGNSNISTVVIEQVNNTVSIKVSGDAYVQMVYINDGCNDVILKGEFGSVNVTGRDINVAANNATISEVILTGSNTSLNVSEGTTIDNVTLAKTASNAKVEITGSVSNVLAEATNSEIKVDDNGTVSSIVANKSAEGIKIDVLAGATVNSVTSGAPGTIVSGDGKVENATMNGDNSKISTPDTVVTVGENTTGVQNNTDITATPIPLLSTTPTPILTTVPVIVPPTGGDISATPVPSTTPTVSPTITITPTTTITPTPTVIPTTTVTPTPKVLTPSEEAYKYQTDERFETGYPQVSLGTKVGTSTNVTVSLKLKEGIASEESPAVIYYIVSNSNTSWDVSSDSVMHGHLGTDSTYTTGIIHPIVYSNYSGAIKVTNTNTVEVPFTIYGSGNEGMVTYFVIKTATSTSELPTKIAFTSDTVSSFTDSYGPTISSTYWSEATTNTEGDQQRTIRLFVSESIDPASVSGGAISIVSGGAITVTGITEGSITNVNIHNKTGSYYYDNYIDLTLTYPVGTDLSNLKIEYTPLIGVGFTDMANVPNKMGSFILYRTAPSSTYNINMLIKDAAPIVEKLYVSDDGKYINVRLSPKINAYNYSDYDIKINGELWNLRSWEFSFDYCELYFYNETATKESSYTIEITKRDVGSKITDVMDQEYETVSKIITDSIASSITATATTLDLSDKSLKLTLEGNCSDVYNAEYGCQYVLTIDGVEYRLRGRGSQDYSVPSNEGKVYTFNSECMLDIDLSKLTTTSVVTFSFRKLSTYPDYFDSFKEVSGKPIEDFTINVTITD